MQVLGDFKTTVGKSLSEIDPKWRNYDGLVVYGTHTPHNPEIIIDAISKARETGTPALLICFGHQMAAVEYARNILGIEDATSEELSDEGTFVVKRLPHTKVGLHDGESYWNNYEVDINMNLPDNFVSVQYHPEYQSSKDNPHKDLVKFLKLCKEYEN